MSAPALAPFTGQTWLSIWTCICMATRLVQVHTHTMKWIKYRVFGTNGCRFCLVWICVLCLGDCVCVCVCVGGLCLPLVDIYALCC